MLSPWKKSYDQLRQHIKKQRHYFANKGLSSQSYGFSSSHVWMWELDYKESWVPKNWCFWTVVLEKILESPLDCKEVLLVHPKDISPEYSLERLMLKLKLQYLATWCEELTHWKRPWCWETLTAGEADDRGWDAWMASPIQWTWDWASSGSWWWTGKPGMLQCVGSQRVGHDWATELNWERTVLKLRKFLLPSTPRKEAMTALRTREAQTREVNVPPTGKEPGSNLPSWHNII